LGEALFFFTRPDKKNSYETKFRLHHLFVFSSAEPRVMQGIVITWCPLQGLLLS